MKSFAILFTVTLCLTPLGCSRREGSRAVSLSESPVEPRVAIEKSADALDDEAMAAVLGDLLSFSGEDSPVAVQGSPPSEILFAAKPAQYAQTVDQVLYQYQKEPWKKLTPAEITASQEAAENLVGRLKSGDYPAEFKTQDKRVRIDVEREPQTEQDFARSMDDRPIQAWPPGYSNDRRFAVVRLVIPWSIHHADGTYLLFNDDGKWTVRLRQFVYYL